MNQKESLNGEKQYIDKAVLIFIRNRHVLVGRNEGYEVYFLPGGAQEKDETLEEALTREVKEELSVGIKPDSVSPLSIFEAPSFEKPDEVFIRMNCFSAELEGQPLPSAEVQELSWFKYEDRVKTSQADILVFEYLKDKDVID